MNPQDLRNYFSQLGKIGGPKRWADKTQEERQAHSKRMYQAKMARKTKESAPKA